MPLFLRKFPFNDTIVILEGENRGKSTDELSRWVESIEQQADASPTRPQPAEVLLNISASETGTLGGIDAAGLYRVTVYREVRTPDPVSSALNGSINWTHNGKALTRALAAFGGAPQTINDTIGDTCVVQIDPGTAISYTLTYASNTPALARFDATLMSELLQTVG
jgi:hypothetical protein